LNKKKTKLDKERKKVKKDTMKLKNEKITFRKHKEHNEKGKTQKLDMVEKGKKLIANYEMQLKNEIAKKTNSFSR